MNATQSSENNKYQERFIDPDLGMGMVAALLPLLDKDAVEDVLSHEFPGSAVSGITVTPIRVSIDTKWEAADGASGGGAGPLEIDVDATKRQELMEKARQLLLTHAKDVGISEADLKNVDYISIDSTLVVVDAMADNDTQKPNEASNEKQSSMRHRVAMADPYKFIDYLVRNSSNNPVKNMQKEFGMSVYKAATGRGGNVPLNTLNTLIPGHATIYDNNQQPAMVEGYLWEVSASRKSDPEGVVKAHCFMQTNDRQLFFKLFTEEEGTDLDKRYWCFVPDEQPASNLH